MKAWTQHEEGDFAEKMKLVPDFPLPKPFAGQVLVKMCASTVNPIDWKVTLPPFSAGLNFEAGYVSGCDGCGVVAELGDGVTNVKVGEKVFFHTNINLGAGAYAEFALVPEAGVEPYEPYKHIFDDFSATGALGCAMWTAAQALLYALDVKQGDTLFVNGGAGGVGSFAIQLASAIEGVRVICTASEKKREFVDALLGGADRQGHAIIDYTKGDVAGEVKKLTGGAGCNRILDTVSDHTTSGALIASVASFDAKAAVLLPIAMDSGLFTKNINLSFIFWGGALAADPKLGRRVIERARALICSSNSTKKKVTIPITDRFAFDEVPKALAANKTGRMMGKVLVTVNAEVGQ